MGIRWGLGLFRMWAVLGGLWVAVGCLLFWLDRHGIKPCAYSMSNMPNVPPFECTEPMGITDRDITLLVAIFGPPILVLLFACALRWALQGFRPEEN